MFSQQQSRFGVETLSLITAINFPSVESLSQRRRCWGWERIDENSLRDGWWRNINLCLAHCSYLILFWKNVFSKKSSPMDGKGLISKLVTWRSCFGLIRVLYLPPHCMQVRFGCRCSNDRIFLTFPSVLAFFLDICHFTWQQTSLCS